MALRTIADLPALDVDNILKDPDLQENIRESLFEISYMEEVGQYDTYKSKHVKFYGLSGLITDAIVNGDFNFYGNKIFYDGIGVSSDLVLSGNLFVNKDLSPDVWNNYNVNINAGDILLNSQNTNICSETLAVYTNYGQFKTYDGNKTVVDWDANSFQVYVPFYASNISCNNITAAGNAVFNGTATFKNTIQGCALCARWADLAELYKSDADYPVGTLVKFGGEAEITVAGDGVANAVITDKPGLILNGSDGKDGLYKGIALVGRTPVLTACPIKKFSRLALDPDNPGTARLAEEHDDIIAVTLEGVSEEGVCLVECAVQLRL